ncbi:MAG TPA: RraA family protein, partial [Burkholderiales bacterium]|nr:RraA family protein [Burkholderiales bacterium]
MAAGFRILPSPGRPSPALVAALAELQASLLSDNMSRLQGAGSADLRPMHRGGTLAGPAFTVKVAPGDNLMVHKAIDLAAPGDVIVVDAGGHLEQAIIGEIMSSWAAKRGVA